MTAQPKRYTTEQEYVVFERASTTKHEYYAGEVFAMAGGTIRHNIIATNTVALLHSQLRGTPCRALNSDMRVKVLATGLQTYPDVTVICGQPLFLDTSQDVIVNPTIIIEVLSPSTEAYDRGLKSQNYRMIETLREYFLVSQDKHHIEHYIRQDNGQWVFNEASDSDARMSIPTINAELIFTEIYDGVDISGEDPAPTRTPPGNAAT